jgi:hypothetical protein
MIEALRSKVHILTNQMQAILGYLELEEYQKALTATKLAIRELRGIATVLTGHMLSVRSEAVIVPDRAVVKKASEVKHPELKKNTVVIVPRKDIQEK